MLLVATVVATACGSDAARLDADDGAEPRDHVIGPVEWMLADRPDPSSNRLTIIVALGECALSVEDVVVEESDAVIVIDVLARVIIPEPGWACPSVQLPTDVEVWLDDPLGAREIVGDGMVDSI